MLMQMIVLTEFSTILHICVTKSNSTLRSPQSGCRNTTCGSSKKHKPLDSVTVVGVQSGGIRRVSQGTDNKDSLQSNLVGQNSKQRAAEDHDTKGERVCAVDEVGLLLATSTSICYS